MAAGLALSPDQIARLNTAERKRDDPKLKLKTRQDAIRTIAGIEKSRRDREDEVRALADVEETRALANARGEEVIDARVTPTRTRLRILSRDGLAYLYEGGLSQRRYDAGMIYRRAYEGAQARGTTARYGERLAGGDASEAATVRSTCDQKRSAMEMLCQDEAELTALRMVAGEGRTIRSFAGGGRSRRRHAKALLIALDRVADHNGLKAY